MRVGFRTAGQKRALAAGWVFLAAIPTQHSRVAFAAAATLAMGQTDGRTDGHQTDGLRVDAASL